MDRTLWLAERRTGIGSSDAAAVCGLSPHAGPLDVYLDKLGLLPPRQTPAMEWGLRLEDAIARAFAETHNVEVQQWAGVLARWGGALARHPEHSFMVATPDRYLPAARAILELKTARTDAGWGPSGTDEVPEGYLLQVQHQLAVCGLDDAYLAVLIGGSDFRTYHLPRHPLLIASLISIEGAFWSERVLKRDPPPPDWSDPRTPELVGLLHRPAEGKTIDLDSGSLVFAEAFEAARLEAQGAERMKAHFRAVIIEAMGDAERGRLPDGRVVTRKVVQRKGYTVAPCEFTDFRISKGPKHE